MFYSEGYWSEPVVDTATQAKTYGPVERLRIVGKLHRMMHQLNLALEELDKEGWELVSTSIFAIGLVTIHGTAALRRARA